jgi:tetratricopeptide (TPR) repeat protein
MRSGDGWLSRFRVRKPQPGCASRGDRRASGATEQGEKYIDHRDRGLNGLASGNLDQAVKELADAVGLRPDLLEAHMNIARALHRTGKIEAARRAYERALAIEPTCTQAQDALDSLPLPPPTREDFQLHEALRSGSSVATYEVLQIKRGGFGVVYIVRDGRSGEIKALKTFQARYLWSDEDRDRFEREAITWLMLDHHPNIVTAQFLEVIEGLPCLTLEYVSGGDLAEVLQKGPLPVERALELALQFCDGMAYAHRQLGLVHRDVKPANCLLAEDGTLKVTDFGLARAFGQGQERLLGISGIGAEVGAQYTTTAGTLKYMAPEQFRHGVELDTRTDVYAFGIMFYHMLTGDLPVTGPDASTHIQTNAVGRELPERLLRVILDCVQPDVTKRPADFGDVREGLAAYLTGTGSHVPSTTNPRPMKAADWQLRGGALTNLARHEEALTCCNRGLEIDPHLAGLWQNKGASLDGLGRYEEALACYDEGLKIDPHEAGLWENKGVTLQALHRYDEALTCLDEGFKIDPRNAGRWSNRGVVLYQLGRYEEALTSYDRGLEIDRRHAVLWSNRGNALQALHRYEEALTSYDRGLEVDPRNAGLWTNRGVLLAELGRHDEALTSYDRGLEIDPSSAALWHNKGNALHALRRYEELLVSCDRGLEIGHRHPGLWTNRGNALLGLGRHKEALTSYDRGFEIDPSFAGLWSNKGTALRRLGRTKEAEKCFQKARELGGQ